MRRNWSRFKYKYSRVQYVMFALTFVSLLFSPSAKQLGAIRRSILTIFHFPSLFTGIGSGIVRTHNLPAATMRHTQAHTHTHSQNYYSNCSAKYKFHRSPHLSEDQIRCHCRCLAYRNFAIVYSFFFELRSSLYKRQFL